MYPQERFPYYKRPFWPVLCLKRIGLPCCTFVSTVFTCLLQIILLSNYSATYNFNTCRQYLAENHLSFPSAPRWVRHSYLLKRLQLIPYTCGSSDTYVKRLQPDKLEPISKKCVFIGYPKETTPSSNNDASLSLQSDDPQV